MRKLPRFSTAVGIVLLVVAAGGAHAAWQARQLGEVAAGYLARQMCGCVYVQNRQEDECLAEMRADLGDQVDRAQIVYFQNIVMVNFLGLDQARAELRPGFGCSVGKFEGSMPMGLDVIPEEN